MDRPPARRPPAEKAAPRGWRSGSRVAVRNRFTGGWAAGFQIEDTDESSKEGYRLRRLSDDAVLPVTFPEEDLRLV